MHVHVHMYRTYSRKLSREKTFANVAFLWQSAKVLSAKCLSHMRLNLTHTHPLQIAKVFSAKSYFSLIHEEVLSLEIFRLYGSLPVQL